jgi:hypothetical protein
MNESDVLKSLEIYLSQFHQDLQEIKTEIKQNIRGFYIGQDGNTYPMGSITPDKCQQYIDTLDQYLSLVCFIGNIHNDLGRQRKYAKACKELLIDYNSRN